MNELGVIWKGDGDHEAENDLRFHMDDLPREILYRARYLIAERLTGKGKDDEDSKALYKGFWDHQKSDPGRIGPGAVVIGGLNRAGKSHTDAGLKVSWLWISQRR